MPVNLLAPIFYWNEWPDLILKYNYINTLNELPTDKLPYKPLA